MSSTAQRFGMPEGLPTFSSTRATGWSIRQRKRSLKAKVPKNTNDFEVTDRMLPRKSVCISWALRP